MIRFMDFAMRVTAGVPGALGRRAGDSFRQLERVFLASLPIIAVAGFSVGLLTWLQTRRQLAQFGLEANLPSLLMAAVVLETGPTLTGLLLAGRMGAGLAAEVGSMSLTEELEAREVMGSPMERSVAAPRILACAVAAPFLTVIFDVASFLGGLAAESGFGTLAASAFQDRALDYLKLAEVVPATLKTLVFGAIVGLCGCWRGAQASHNRSAESVGRAATRGVVSSMLAVLIANILMTPYLQTWSTWMQQTP